MKPWIPIIAVLGLVIVASVPAPGIVGVAIGGLCIALIVGWALAIAFQAAWDRTMGPVIAAVRKLFQARRRRRQFHAGSGLARKQGARA
jgi:hypothetical protein